MDNGFHLTIDTGITDLIPKAINMCDFYKNYYIWSSCASPAIHFFKISTDGNSSTKCPKGPHERYIVVTGSCPSCRWRHCGISECQGWRVNAVVLEMVHDRFEAGTKVFGGQWHQIFRPVYNTHVTLDNGMSTPMHRETKPATIGVHVSHGAFSEWWKSKYPAVEKFLFSSFALCRFGSLLWWSRFSQLALFNSPRSTGPIHLLTLTPALSRIVLIFSWIS